VDPTGKREPLPAKPGAYDLVDAEALREIPDDVPHHFFGYSASPDQSAFVLLTETCSRNQFSMPRSTRLFAVFLYRIEPNKDGPPDDIRK